MSPNVHMVMGQNPVPPTKIKPKIDGEFTYPKMGSHWF